MVGLLIVGYPFKIGQLQKALRPSFSQRAFVSVDLGGHSNLCHYECNLQCAIYVKMDASLQMGPGDPPRITAYL